MTIDNKNGRQGPREQLQHRSDATTDESHVVFDFTGLEQVTIGDLSLILTARLMSAPTDNVWVRSLPQHTAEVLKMLRLDHLFRHYPEGGDQMN